jgi:surface polysaccharide O-acyltransferase-like enzyme
MVWLDVARVVSIFAVVFVHVSASVVTERDFGTADWWYGNVYDSLTRWCVPVFVMISGALLLGSDKNDSVLAFYRKRTQRILVPLIIWSLVFIFWETERATFSLDRVNVVAAMRSIASGKPHYHMWFLFMIVSLYLFTPFIRILVRNATRAELWLLVGLLFVVAASHEISGTFVSRGAGLFVVEFLSYLPYFLCGHLIASSKKKISSGALLAVFGGSVLTTAIGCYVLGSAHGLGHGLYFYTYLSITVIPMSISLMWLFKVLSFDDIPRSRFRHLSELTLGVYLIHPLFLESFRVFVLKQEEYFPLLSVPIVSAIIFAVSMLSAFVFYRIPYLKRAI